jgi:hypothetical protein
MDGKIILEHKQIAHKRNLLNRLKIRPESRFKKSVEWTCGNIIKLKIEAISSSEMLIAVYQTARR